MDKGKIFGFLISSLFIFVLVFIYSKFGPNIPISLLTQQKGEPLVVSGEGKVTVVPDIAQISLSIEEQGQTLKQVQKSVDEKSQDLTKKLKEMDVDEKDIKTSNYNIYPSYNYDVSPYRINGYRVSVSYEVNIKDIDKTSDILSAVTLLGVNEVGGITFKINDKTKLEKLNQAREIAVKEAKEKAQGLAKAAGITLGKIINISEQQGGTVLRNYAKLPVTGGGAEDTSAQVDIQPGETELLVTVNLSFEIK